MDSTHTPYAMAAEFARNTDHDWIQAIARKTRQYGRHATDKKATYTLDSIGRMVDAYRLSRSDLTLSEASASDLSRAEGNETP